MRRTKKQRFARGQKDQCVHYVVGDVVLVIVDHRIVTVIPKRWLQ